MRRVVVCLLAFVLLGPCADAAAECVFDVAGATWRLAGDCTTDASIVLPDGVTLDGGNQTITAVDPRGGHFVGAVIAAGGASASVVNTRITAGFLADVCDGGVKRLRGILFDGAAGTIRGNVVTGINQGRSRCQEGTAIEVRNCGSVEDRVKVEIESNVVDGYQKAGIVVSCEVDAWVRHNNVGASATQTELAANAVQIGFGAWALVERNQIAGNSWSTRSAAAAAVLLLRTAEGTVVSRNEVVGNADVGIFIRAEGAIVEGNRVVDSGPDGYYDIGIGNYDVTGMRFSTTNLVTDNDVKGFATAYDGPGGPQTTGGSLQVE